MRIIFFPQLMFQSKCPALVMIRIAALVEIWICVERINVIFTDKLSYRLSKLTHIVGTWNSARHSNATSQSCQHKRRQNSDDGGDHQQFNQREAISIGPAHIDWTVALLECHEWLSGDVAIENMTRDETSKGVCSPGTRNLCSVGGWSRRSDTSFRLFFQWPTTSLPA